MTEEEAVDDTIVILEAIPKSNEQFVAFGKIWIRKDDFSVLKIEWHPKSIRNFEEVAEIAERYKSEPDVTIITEFSFEKNADDLFCCVTFPAHFFSFRPGQILTYHLDQDQGGRSPPFICKKNGIAGLAPH